MASDVPSHRITIAWSQKKRKIVLRIFNLRLYKVIISFWEFGLTGLITTDTDLNIPQTLAEITGIVLYRTFTKLNS